MRKQLFVLTLFVVAILPLGTAVVTAPPQQNTTIATVNNSTASVVKNTFPFDVTNKQGNLTVTPGYAIEPGSYSGEVTLSTGNTTAQTVKIPRVSNWTLSTASLHNTISVGNDGEIENITVQLTGNTQNRLTANLTGNLTQYYDVNPFFDVFPGLNKTITIGYGVPSDTEFGEYTGKLVLEDRQGRNRTVNLTADFKDEIRPEITDTRFSDTMATQTVNQTLSIQENLEVDSVRAEVTRTVEVQKDNRTVEVNETVGTSILEHRENTDVWVLPFKDTGTIAPYYVNITVNDTAGNTVSTTESFTVDGLDAVNVVNGDFQFSKISEQSQTENVILENTVKSAFNLSLSSFNYAGNSTHKIGVVPPNATQPVRFEDETLNFEKTGEYSLVVKFYDDEPRQDLYQYDGTIQVSVPEQHYPVNDIRFGGTVDSFGYPEPQTIFEGGADFEGYIGYSFDSVKEGFEQEFGGLEEGETSGYAYKISRIDVEACKGDDSWGGCSQLTMGQYQDTIQRNNQLQTERDAAIAIALVAVIFTGLYIRKENLDTQLAMPTYKK